MVSVALGGPEWSVVLGHHEDEDRYGYSRGSDAWNALDAVVTLVLGGECHPSFVVDLDTCTVVTVVSDLELGDAGQVGDVLQLPSDDTVAVDFEGEMAAAEDLHLRCHEYGMAWPPVGP